MRWVADTGPVLHLVEAGAMHLLPLLGEVVVPPAVLAELRQFPATTSLPSNLQIVPLSSSAEATAEDWGKAGLVHRGEAQAIALARQIEADYLLTDDAAARLLSTSLGLRARGSLGIILWLAGQRRIGTATASVFLDRLTATSLWVSPKIMAEARAALQDMSRK